MSAAHDYEVLACSSFARQFAKGKTVAVIGTDTATATRPLAATAASLTGPLSESGDLSRLPEAGFDVVVALGTVGDLGSLAQQAKRVLTPDGVLVVSAPERAVSGFGEVLERDFKKVRTYRLAAVAGAAVFEDGAFARVGLPSVVPTTGSLLAVCSDAGVPEVEDVPYLTLDPHGRVFEEVEELSEEVELLRGEILRMQESEAQAFGDTLTLRTSETNHFRSRLERSEMDAKAAADRLENQIGNLRGQNQDLRNQNHALREQLNEIKLSRSWRVMGLYRRLAARMGRG